MTFLEITSWDHLPANLPLPPGLEPWAKMIDGWCHPFYSDPFWVGAADIALIVTLAAWMVGEIWLERRAKRRIRPKEDS